MREAPIKKPSSSPKFSREPPPHIGNKENQDKTRIAPRQSELSAQINTKTVVQGILNTPITLPLCKILGTSKEISQTLQDTIKLKNKPPIASINHASTFPGLGIYGKNGLITL